MILPGPGGALQKTASFGPSQPDARIKNFWAEVAPHEHLVQIYKDDEGRAMASW
jgi:hypothetical protein